jgi:hypothetical protein
MRLSFIKSWVGLLLSALLLLGCNLEKDIDINLPPYQSQMVVECYLQAGEPYRLSLVESSGYLELPEIKLITDATVTISANGHTDTLKFAPFLDEATGKYFTHSSNRIMQGQPGNVYTLTISDKQGRVLTGTTTVLPIVKIDTVEFKFNNKKEALITARFKDSAGTKDFYRFVVHKDSLSRGAEVDYASPDELNNGQPFVFGTGYDFAAGDSVVVTLHHLEEALYDFQESVEDARRSNGNPFAQPGRVKSTVQGGLGVFTSVVFDRKKLVVPEK